MGEIIEGLGDQQRRRAKELLEGGHYFWIDVVSDGEAPEVLAKELRIDDRALKALLDFDPDAPPSRRFHIDGKHVAFAMSCYVETPEGESTGLPLLEGHERELVDVRVLVTAGYLLTIHEQPISLPDLLQIQEPGGRSEQYMVYAVLDAMVATAYDALSQAEIVLEECRVPAADRIGRDGEAFDHVKQVLDKGRIGIGALAIGLGRASLEVAIGYAKERKQFGKAIAEFEMIQWRLARARTELDAARLVARPAAPRWVGACPFRIGPAHDFLEPRWTFSGGLLTCRWT